MKMVRNANTPCPYKLEKIRRPCAF
ncbi:hypothetical protein F383_06427 [Gossypium arboreum]|uniref:Uncharacterized protein n=1 Tax=Gossypium arboreum TaxID=29729 RepID=A0A0B0NNC9_GOSAR|nr:hypothetical protein F383_06427 [Gossypium arboreum]